MSASTSSREDNAGEVVYSRSAGIGDQAEDWDDTSLIEAYDAALGGILDKLDEREKHPPSRASSAGQTKWIKGQFCRAQYSEDKQWYEAKIIATDGGYCIVKYLGYNNHERRPLNALKASDGPRQRKLQIDAAQMEQSADSDDSRDEERSAADLETIRSKQSIPTDKIFKREQPSPSQRQRQQQHLEHLLQLQEQQVRATSGDEHVSKPSSSKQTQKQGKDSCRKRGANESAMPSVIAFPPPPPPFPPGVDEICDGDEALAAMLISWYISGYHTGYYSAVRNSTKR